MRQDFATSGKGEPMDDLISRQALRSDMYHEAMEKDSEEQRWDGGCWIRYKMFERVVDRQPSAQPEKCEDCGNFNKTRLVIPQPERKKGKWVREDGIAHGIVSRVVKCSLCGKNAGLSEEGFWHLSDFCPNCGARMESDSE